MISEKQFFETLALINVAALDITEWKNVLLKLARLTDCVAGGLTVENPINRRGRPLTYFGFDENHVQRTFDYYLPMNPLFSIFPKMVPGFVVTNGDVIAPESFQRTEFYNGWARPQQIGSPLTLVLHRSAESYCPLTLVRPDGAGEATAASRALLRRLAPHLINALGISLRLETLKAQTGPMETALARLAMSVFLLDARGRITYANPAAEAFLEAGTVLFSKDGVLRTRDAKAQRELQTATAVAGHCGHAAEVKEINVAAADQVHPVALTVVPLAVESLFAPLLSTAPCCAVFVNDRRSVERAQINRFARHYKLTPAETRLLEAIISGLSLVQAAEGMDVKPSTAHTHLKRVFAKTGTNRQGALINLALTSFPPLRADRNSHK